MTHAVIKTGGKQYLVSDGAVVQVDKLPLEEGKAVKFEEVLLISDGTSTTIGAPFVSAAVVEGEVIEQGRHKKIFGAKVKPKKRYKKIFGHKQPYTAVKITAIKTR